ncbi:PEP-CTERM sorting domain-containing protein [Isosphaeraceae bacterium EP7]
MHRMRSYALKAGLTVLFLATLTLRADAGLIRPAADRAFPDISADINGVQSYVYDPATGTGTFQVTNTPYLIAGEKTLASEYPILPNSADGVRRQIVSATLDANGQLVADSPTNKYELWGTIVTDKQTYSGLLLSGTPTKFGSQDLGSLGISGTDLYDFELKITGGALKEYFGKDAYMRIQPELLSTFDGSFTKDFSAVKATSNTRGYNSPKPFPVPEPTTLIMLLTCGVGLAFRRKLSAPDRSATDD